MLCCLIYFHFSSLYRSFWQCFLPYHTNSDIFMTLTSIFSLKNSLFYPSRSTVELAEIPPFILLPHAISDSTCAGSRKPAPHSPSLPRPAPSISFRAGSSMSGRSGEPTQTHRAYLKNQSFPLSQGQW